MSTSTQKIKKNPRCKRNDFDEYNVPIDGVTFDSIPENEVYVLNERCYNVETIKQILRTSGEDPFSREKISKDVYNELLPIDNDLSLKFIEDFTEFTKTMLNDKNFKDNIIQYKEWMLNPPTFNNNKRSVKTCKDLVNDIILIVKDYQELSNTISKQDIALSIGTAIYTMGIFFGLSTVSPVIVGGIIGGGVGSIQSRRDRSNEMLKVNKLFEDYINCVNNIYMV